MCKEAVKVIGSHLGTKVSILSQVESSMRQLESKFIVMQAFISQVHTQPSCDTAYDAWVAQVKKVAHDAENVVDECAYMIGKTAAKCNLLKKW